MTTKIILFGAATPTESTGADVNKDAALNGNEYDQTIVNLRAAVDRKSPVEGPGSSQAFAVGALSASTLNGFATSQTPAANQIPVVKADGTTAFPSSGSFGSTGASPTVTIGRTDGYYKTDLVGSTGADGNEFHLKTNNTSRMIIDADGNMLFGASSGSFHNFTKSAAACIAFENTRNTGTEYVVRSNLGSNNNNTNSIHFYGDTGGFNKVIIYGNGDIQNVNNSYGAISDIKLKENISIARSYLEDLCQVNVVKYSLIVDASETATHLGVIAQELEEIFPGMVEVTKDTAERPSGKFEQKEIAPAVMDGELTIAPPVYDDDETKPIMERYETGEVTKGVKYSVFVPMLITAVKDLNAKYTALEARLAALEQI